MAMRVTAKMMQGNSLSNLNTNKALQDRLTTQLSTLKKITRPSDDPVIAIRSLRLNCTLSKVDQYYEKNSKDAAAWLKLTDDSLDTVTKILTDMKSYATQCANGDLKASDRSNIVMNLHALKEEIYGVGNADYEGRSIFTGYRTGLPLTFKEDFTKQYGIKEQIHNTDFDTVTFVKTGDLKDINEGNFNQKVTDANGDPTKEYTQKTQEYDVGTYEIHRYRMAYSGLDKVDIADTTAPNNYLQMAYNIVPPIRAGKTADEAPETSVSFNDGTKVKLKLISESAGKNQIKIGDNDDPINLDNGASNGSTVGDYTVNNVVSDNGIGVLTITDGSKNTIELDYTVDELGNITFDDQYFKNIKITGSFDTATDDAYMSVVGDANKDNVTYIASTGELLFGDAIYKEISEKSKDTELRVNYDKSEWLAGDLDPVHYFYTQDKTEKNLFYNAEKLTDPDGDTANQIITYDMGNNQSLRVNTTADEVFQHDIGRDIDQISGLLDQITDMEKVLSNVESMIKSTKYEGDDLKKLEEQKAALTKSMTFLNKKLQTMSENFITKFDGYLDNCNLALTKVGSREARQKLIDNRLGNQQTTFEELVSTNEDADLSELAVQLSSVELTYEAALSSISYVMKTTLLDFI